VAKPVEGPDERPAGALNSRRHVAGEVLFFSLTNADVVIEESV